MVLELENGLVVMYIKVLGKMIKCMVKVSINKQMVESIKVNSLTINIMAMEFENGLMVILTKAIGNKTKNMVKEFINIQIKVIMKVNF
jgi:hypothetical protein